MATVRKRNDKYVVIYDYINEDGKRKQKWETFDDKKEALKKKNQIELDKANNKFVAPTAQTLADFLMEWAEIHGKANWQPHTYSGNMGLIKNHIIPYIGDLDIQKVTPRDIEKLYDTLRSKKISGIRSQGADDTRCLSSTSVRHVHTVLKLAFAKAVEWKLLQASPVVCKAPKKNRNPDRPIWDADTVRLALGSIEDPILRLAVHLAFVCSLRNGETMALTWDCIDFDKKRILVNKTLQRIYKDVMAKLPKDNICFVFPPKVEESKSVLVLKSPKTETSSRYIYITEQLKHELQQRKQQVEYDKEYWGSAYEDFGLVLCLADGYPIEPKLLEKWFKKWQEKTNHSFPELVFHGLRHSSTTYKLMVSSGDVKSVQGDTGHSSADMVVNTYSHIVDRARERLMKSIEGSFYDINSANESQVSDISEDVLELIRKDPLLQQRVLLALSAQE